MGATLSKDIPACHHDYEAVIQKLEAMIASGALKQGDKLPSERELAEKCNVEQGSVHDALKIMDYMGALDNSQGDGCRVKSSKISNLSHKMDFEVHITPDTMIDLQEMRISLETYAAYRAALRRTDEDLADIQQILLEMRKAKRDPDQDSEPVMRNLRELSHKFHRYLVRATHSSVLIGVYENLYEILDISRQFTIRTSGISYNSILAHEAVFNYIIQQDAEGARTSMSEHLQDVREQLNLLLEKN